MRTVSLTRVRAKDFLKKNPLPAKLSTFLLRAVNDLEWVESHPERFSVQMGWWHSTVEKCYVCFAGAYLASNGLPDNVDVAFDSPGWDLLRDSLTLLDNVRQGWWNLVFSDWEGLKGTLNNPRKLQSNFRWWVGRGPKMPEYSINPRKFKGVIRRFALRLREAGL